MFPRRDYQAISAALAGFTPPPTVTPIAESYVNSILLRRAVGGDLQEWLEFFRVVHGDEFIANIFKENPNPANQSLDGDQVNDESLIANGKVLGRLPNMKWIIPHEIPDHGLAMLYGSPSVGKSFVALDYALQIAQDYPVAYVAGEGEYGFKKRFGAWCHYHNKEASEKFWLVLKNVRLLNDEDFDWLMTHLYKIQPRFLIFDTVARAMLGFDENSSRDMGMFVHRIDYMRKELGCTVLLVHHTNKGGLVERGSSALRGACDQIIKLSEEDDCIRWEVQKTKDDESAPPKLLKKLRVAFEMEGEPYQSLVFVPTDGTSLSISNLNKNQKRILECLSLQIFEGGAQTSEIIAETGIARSTIFRVLNALIMLKLIEKEAHGIYKLTSEGLKIAKELNLTIKK